MRAGTQGPVRKGLHVLVDLPGHHADLDFDRRVTPSCSTSFTPPGRATQQVVAITLIIASSARLRRLSSQLGK